MGYPTVKASLFIEEGLLIVMAIELPAAAIEFALTFILLNKL